MTTSEGIVLRSLTVTRKALSKLQIVWESASARLMKDSQEGQPTSLCLGIDSRVTLYYLCLSSKDFTFQDVSDLAYVYSSVGQTAPTDDVQRFLKAICC